MKKTLLFLLILSGFTAYSQPTDLSACDTNGDGIEIFDLTAYWEEFPDYIIPTNYQTQADAENEVNPIANPSAYASGNSTVWVRITDTYNNTFNILGYSLWVNPLPVAPQMPDVTACDSYTLPELTTGSYFVSPGGIAPVTTSLITASQTIYIYAEMGDCADETSFNVTIMPSPVVSLEDGTFCEDFITGTVIEPYILDTGYPNNGLYTFNWFLDGFILPGATENTYIVTYQGIYSVEVKNLGNCIGTDSALVLRSGPASPIGSGYTIDGQNITMTVNGYGNYQYAIDGGAFMDNGGVFMDVPMGLHTVVVYDANGCGDLVVTDILVEIPNAPDGEPSQSFVEGQTLADVVVEGQNIQWYANDNNGNGRMMEATLPLSTILVDGTTYYASQTINGVESSHRLPVTVSLSLGVHHNPFANFSYHPNPVKNDFEISNSETMDSIGIYNVLGQSVVEKTPNAMVSVLDLSGLKTGIYLLRVQSGKNQKTIKIIKE